MSRITVRRRTVVVKLTTRGLGEREDARLDWIAQRVQEIFDLAGLFSNRVQRTGITRHVSTRSSKLVLVAEVVSSCSSDL